MKFPPSAEPSPVHARTPDVWAFLWLCILELAFFLILLALYKKGMQNFAVFMERRAGGVFLGALALGVLSLVGIRARYKSVREKRSREFWMATMLNALILAASLLTAEVTLRVLAEPTPFGPRFGGMALLPLDWKETAAVRTALWRQATADGSYLVYDSLLGWTVGPNGTSANGLYFGSAEGLRSAQPGVELRSRAADVRIALVGDSFTFGLEVPYENSWGAVLEEELGSGVQILNFGVDGFGVDQGYLRYVRDVRPWKPDIVILGIIDHDLERVMGVYSFLFFPQLQMGAKPRFAMVDGHLELLNTPLITPESLFATPEIDSLPYLEYDVAYNPAEWRASSLRYSYLARFVISRFPRWGVPNPRTTDEALFSVNSALIERFVEEVLNDGAVPMLVYFPTRSYFDPSMQESSGEVGSRGLRILRNSGFDYHDMSSCVGELAPEKRFLAVHYSPEANAAVAKCLLQPVLSVMND